MALCSFDQFCGAEERGKPRLQQESYFQSLMIIVLTYPLFEGARVD
jgi:hypothetical protein